MGLCNLRDALKYAQDNGVAIGAFNVADIAAIKGVIRAAEELNSPVILQFTEGWKSHIPLELIAPVMVAAAENAKVDVVVHVDHGRNPEVLEEALELGFSSIMFDGSGLPLEENLAIVNRLAETAQKYNASVEAELGVVGGTEDDTEAQAIKYTRPEEVAAFCKSSRADALAIAIGNAHGHYIQEPELRFDVLAECREVATIPLVLHGGTGITADDFRKAIRMGMSKINISTANFDAILGAISRTPIGEGKDGYFQLSDSIEECVYENAKNCISIFSLKE